MNEMKKVSRVPHRVFIHLTMKSNMNFLTCVITQ